MDDWEGGWDDRFACSLSTYKQTRKSGSGCKALEEDRHFSNVFSADTRSIQIRPPVKQTRFYRPSTELLCVFFSSFFASFLTCPFLSSFLSSFLWDWLLLTFYKKNIVYTRKIWRCQHESSNRHASFLTSFLPSLLLSIHQSVHPSFFPFVLPF